MTIFSEKLDGLLATIDLVAQGDSRELSAALIKGRGRVALAVGSGGSAGSAQYFAACRDSLGMGVTLCQTPMELVLGNLDLSEAQVWLFSARGENPDIQAAMSAARTRGAKDIRLVTSNAGSPLLDGDPHVTGHILPVADVKDGFLSTHSLIAAVHSLLLASELASEHSLDDAGTVFRDEAITRLSDEARKRTATAYEFLTHEDAVIVLADPRLSAASVVIETSLWEAAICPVQRTDFRNFAHGRHTWLARNPETTFVHALTGSLSEGIWHDIRAELPSSIRSIQADYGNAGRLAQAGAVIDALVVVEAMGKAVNIDPGKPGVGEFAKNIYEASSLPRCAARLTPAVRKKWAAISLRDEAHQEEPDLFSLHSTAVAGMEADRYQALVLDYDGTVVETAQRYAPPRSDIVAELTRLLDGGLRLAFATGRGGSGYRALSEMIPERFHPAVVVGYYNGGWIRPLSDNIEVNVPEPSAELAPVADWLYERRGEFVEFPSKAVGRQITIKDSELRNPERFRQLLRSAPFINRGKVVMARSQHSIDIFPSSSSKLNVLAAVRKAIGDDGAVLCIGDSGGVQGNDHDLLGHRHGLSVDKVCHRPDMCWSLYGAELSGPSALLAILKGLTASSEGGFRLRINGIQNG